ncbi:hypothetical protein DEO72_LG2g4231 [Vigna unguiculata]|uniref:Uncharacterized protein n=1 Tax=Vigna unguiculata TaxID=3917 RepID=A0A4D6L5U9_VIGUN|nr:hypothetical protein DEO72_LG2g4231 [Vigna unguiculata]
MVDGGVVGEGIATVRLTVVPAVVRDSRWLPTVVHNLCHSGSRGRGRLRSGGSRLLLPSDSGDVVASGGRSALVISLCRFQTVQW